MSAKGCPLCFSKDVLAEIFCSVRGRLDSTGGCTAVRAGRLIDISGHLHKVLSHFFFVRLSRLKLKKKKKLCLTLHILTVVYKERMKEDLLPMFFGEVICYKCNAAVKTTMLVSVKT